MVTVFFDGDGWGGQASMRRPWGVQEALIRTCEAPPTQSEQSGPERHTQESEWAGGGASLAGVTRFPSPAPARPTQPAGSVPAGGGQVGRLASGTATRAWPTV